jgi:phytoene/squalene synthetase
MEDATPHAYIFDLLRSLDRPRYALVLLAPPAAREALGALYALHAELVHVHASVSEEITAHIRYAWWQEALAELDIATKPRAHPVLEALMFHVKHRHMDSPLLAGWAGQFREAYPAMPDMEPALAQAARQLFDTMGEKPDQRWLKASELVQAHRARHGKKRYLSLIWRLWLLSLK